MYLWVTIFIKLWQLCAECFLHLPLLLQINIWVWILFILSDDKKMVIWRNSGFVFTLLPLNHCSRHLCMDFLGDRRNHPEIKHNKNQFSLYIWEETSSNIITNDLNSRITSFDPKIEIKNWVAENLYLSLNLDVH